MTPPPPSVPPVVTTPTAVRVSRATPFAAACLEVPSNATIYANSEVEPHLAVDPANPNHLVAAWQQDRLSDGGARGLVTAVSVDGGTTWSGHSASPFSRCAGADFARVSDPWVSRNGTTVVQAGIAFTGAALTAGARSAVLAARSSDGGFTWSGPSVLIDDDGAQHFNDKETVTVDATDPRLVYAVWDRLDREDRGPTWLARSTDGGLTWSPARAIYDPGDQRQTIGNVVTVGPNGTLHNFFTELGPAADDPRRTEGHLALIRSLDKGLSWSAPVRIAELLAVSTRVPAQTQLQVRAGEVLGTFAVDPVRGTLYAAWQDSRFTAGAHNAIVVSVSRDDGATWSAPARVSADPSVPAFTPTIAVLQDGTIGISYFDFRRPSATGFQPTEHWLAASRDGVNWQETRLAGNFDLLNAPNANGLFVGDYQGLVGAGASFVALYSRVNNADTANRTDTYADRVDAGTLVSSGLASRSESAKTQVPAWTAEAQSRVDEHLAKVVERRRARWQRLLEEKP